LQLQIDANKAEKFAFEQTTNERLKDNPDFLTFLFISYESDLDFSGHVKKWNVRIWAHLHEQAQSHQYRPLCLKK